jgi:hypothetical protein
MPDPTTPPEGTPPAGDTVTMSADNWRELIPEDIREDPSIAKYTDFGAFVKGHINAVGMIGKDKFTLPETDEQWTDIYGRLGRPDAADGYELTAPEGVSDEQKFDETFDKTLTEMMHGLGLSSKQAQGMNEFLYNTVVTSGKDTAEAGEALKAEALTELRSEYGANVDAHVEVSMRIIRELGGEGAEGKISKDDLLENPILVKILSGIANKVLEDTGLDGGEQGMTRTDIKTDIAEAMGHPAYMDRKHIEHKQQVDKVYALRQRLQGIAA